MAIDSTDIKIVNLMLESGSVSCTQIAKALGVSGVTIHNHVKKLRNLGALKGNTPVIDPKSFGYDLTAFINVVASGDKEGAIEERYRNHKNVCALYDISGHYDLVIIGKFKNSNELHRFVDELRNVDGVNRTNTSLVFKALKESTMPNCLD